MHPLVPVMLGGALGAAGRYLTGAFLVARLGGGFPYGTLAVNLTGGFVMGLLAALLLRGEAGEGARLFVGIGILGGFTTFSAFGLETWTMVARGDWGTALGYTLASVTGSVAMVGMGLWLGKTFA
jgi:fluoride exporter